MRTILPLLLLAATPSFAQQPVPPAAASQPAAPRSPFQLTPQEQAYVDQVLAMWEAQGAKIKTFRCPFTKWTYNSLSPRADMHFSEESGALSYEKPDKGSYKIETVKQWKFDPIPPGQPPQPNAPRTGKYVAMTPKDGVVPDHWVSDGKSIYEYRHLAKQLVVSPIPADMQGEDIVNGPFPFLFGAKAADLKRRFWMRPHANPDKTLIHLVALPKTRVDAANYKAVEIMLDRQTFLPRAMQIHLPVGDRETGREVFSFDLAKVEVNARTNPLWQALFQSPRTPWGWEKVVDQPAMQQAAGPAAQPR